MALNKEKSFTEPRRCSLSSVAPPPGVDFNVPIFWSIAVSISTTTTWNLPGCDISHVHITSASQQLRFNVSLPPQVWWASTSPRSKSSSQSWFTWPKAPRSSWNASLLESKFPFGAFVAVTVIVLIFLTHKYININALCRLSVIRIFIVLRKLSPGSKKNSLVPSPEPPRQHEFKPLQVKNKTAH